MFFFNGSANRKVFKKKLSYLPKIYLPKFYFFFMSSEKQDTQLKLKTGTIIQNDGEQILINALLDLQTKEAEVLDIQRQIQEHIRIIEHLKLDLKNKESAVQNSRVNLRNILYFFGQDLDNFIKIAQNMQ